MTTNRRRLFVISIVCAITLAACSLLGQRVTIAENERGVFANDLGELQLLKPGTHTLSMFSSEPTIYSLSDQTYTMTEQPTPVSAVQGNDAVEARSKDGLQVWVSAAVTFHFMESKLTLVRKTWRDSESFLNNFIRPTTRNVIYNTVAQYRMAEATSTMRGNLETAISRQLAEEFTKQGAEIVRFSLLDVHSGQVK